MVQHKLLTPSEIHPPFAWEFDTQVERLAEAVDVDDLYKVAIQLDNNSLWILTNESPVTWVKILSGPDSAPPSGVAGGQLSGFYPNPEVVNDGHNHTPGVSIPVYPTTLPPSGAAGGDLTGTYPNPNLRNVSGLTAGTYYKPTVTVDAKGRVTSITGNTDPTITFDYSDIDITGVSTTTTPPYGDDSTRIANTRWVSRGATTRESLALGETLTIADGYQKVVHQIYTVNGTLIVNGKLVINDEVDETIQPHFYRGVDPLVIPRDHFKVVCAPFINRGVIQVYGTLKII